VDSDGYPADGPPADDGPLFKDSGFDSIDDYLDHKEELWRKEHGIPPPLPAGLRSVGPHDGHGSRQVGLRLPELDFRRLSEIGDEYGLAPATLARLIVVRAVRSRRFDPRD
jgi:hypothetical protein